MKKGKIISCLFVVFLVFLSFFPDSAIAQDENGWTYEVNDKGEATITAYTGPDGNATTPAQLGGYDITVR